jgi:hypothetical protein
MCMSVLMGSSLSICVLLKEKDIRRDDEEIRGRE